MKILVTGSSGLVGSEAVTYFDRAGHEVVGVDNNMRADFFGPQGDTSATLAYLKENTQHFTPLSIDIRDRQALLDLFCTQRFDATIHAAAQPSHDLATSRPFDDFDVNAVGTINLLEASRLHAPESPFVYLSTNKVYGDAPNRLRLDEHPMRWDYADTSAWDGIDETCSIDQNLHSLFGASKLAGDVLVQEYGRYFNMPTVCFRAGCITGPLHKGVELHGFLSYLVKCAVQGKQYTIWGYKGKQVRDQIHSYDVVRAAEEFIREPRVGEVYNLGGGRQNSLSILEAVQLLERHLGHPMDMVYNDQNRRGDHICYISNTNKLETHYPDWKISRKLEPLLLEIVQAELETVRR